MINLKLEEIQVLHQKNLRNSSKSISRDYFLRIFLEILNWFRIFSSDSITYSSRNSFKSFSRIFSSDNLLENSSVTRSGNSSQILSGTHSGISPGILLSITWNVSRNCFTDSSRVLCMIIFSGSWWKTSRDFCRNSYRYSIRNSCGLPFSKISSKDTS